MVSDTQENFCELRTQKPKPALDIVQEHIHVRRYWGMVSVRGTRRAVEDFKKTGHLNYGIT